MPSSEYLQSVQRTVRILYAVAGAEDGRTIRQIADATNLKHNTAYKFVRTLENEGLLSRREQPIRFTLGHALTELNQLDNDRHLLSVGADVLKLTSAKMPEGNFALFEFEFPLTWQRLCVETTRPGVLIRRRAFSIHPYIKASSLLFLAYSTPEQIADYLKLHPFDLEGQSTWETRENLATFLDRVRSLGYCAPNCPEINVGYRIAFPIFSSGHEPIAAVGGYLLGNVSKQMRQKLLSHCRQAALKVQEAL